MKLNTREVQLARVRAGLSSRELAEKYGCSISRINSLMKKDSVHADTAGKLARALGVDVSEIIVQ